MARMTRQVRISVPGCKSGANVKGEGQEGVSQDLEPYEIG